MPVQQRVVGAEQGLFGVAHPHALERPQDLYGLLVNLGERWKVFRHWLGPLALGEGEELHAASWGAGAGAGAALVVLRR